jgi:hypothetical protein
MNEMQRLLKDLEGDAPFDSDRLSGLKAKLKRESELRQKKWLLSVTLYCLLGLAMMAIGAMMVIENPEEIRIMFLGSAIIIIGFEITVLVKLAYGGQIAMVRILETVREVQISVIEHLQAPSGRQQDEEVKS